MYLSNNNNILTNYIKYKLQNTKFPKLTVWREGLDVIIGNYYLVNGNIAVANKTGSIINIEEDFTIIDSYKKDLLSVAEYNKFSSNLSYYDALTHFYLGEMLRLDRDIYDKDILSMFNVWSGATIGNMELKSSFSYQSVEISDGNNILIPVTQIQILNKEESLYDIMRVDIKPNIEYSIYIESDLPVLMTTIAYDKGRKLVPLQLGNKIFYSMQFSKPMIYKIDITQNMLDSSTDYKVISDYMTLLIQVPKNRGRRLVLEGNYKDFRQLNNGSVIEQISTDLKKSIPSLPNFISDTGSKVFSDRIVSYLTEFAITNTDSIDANIERIQEQISSIYFRSIFGNGYKLSYADGIYTKEMRTWLQEFQSKYQTTDITGFVDTRLEQLISRGVR